MASVQTAAYEGRYLKLTVVEESYSIENNTSTIKWTLDVIGGDTQSYSVYNWGVWVNGQEIYGQQTTSYKTFAFPAVTGSSSGRITINHKADGTASAVPFKLKGKVYVSGDATFEGSCPLTTIPRTSPVSMSNTNITTNAKVTLKSNRKSTAFTHTFTYAFGQATGTIASGVTDSYEWTVPRDLAKQIPNAVKGTGTIFCKTYNGNTYIGQSSVGFALNVDTGLVPTVSSSGVSDGNTTVSGKSLGGLLKGLSWLKATLAGTGSYSSTIKQYNCQYEGTNYSDTTLDGLNKQLKAKALVVGNRTCKLWVTDSRGRNSSVVSKTYTVIDYFAPSITKYNAQRCNSSGAISDSGTYLKIEFEGSGAAVNNKNTFTARVGYKLKTDSAYGNYTNYVNASTTVHTVSKTGSNMVVFGGGKLDASKSYDIVFEVSDMFSSNKRYREISTGFDLIHFHKSGKSIAFGKKSEATDSESKAEFGMDTDFKKAIYLNGKKLLWYE